MSLLIVPALQLGVLHIVICSHPELMPLKRFSGQTAGFKSILVFSGMFLYKRVFHFQKLAFTICEVHKDLVICFCWSWVGPWHLDQGCR